MSWEGYDQRPRPESESFEPLPGLLRLPAWLWRKLRPRGRIAVGVAVVALAGALVASIPGIRSSKRADARRAAQAHRAARALVAADQRPHTAPLRSQGAVVGQLEAAILRDARGRAQRREIHGPITSVSCIPGGPPAGGRTAFHCDAATRSFTYPFQAVADRSAGVLTWCKRDPPSISDEALDVPVSARCRQ
jgi:hypothetical protein